MCRLLVTPIYTFFSKSRCNVWLHMTTVAKHNHGIPHHHVVYQLWELAWWSPGAKSNQSKHCTWTKHNRVGYLCSRSLQQCRCNNNPSTWPRLAWKLQSAHNPHFDWWVVMWVSGASPYSYVCMLCICGANNSNKRSTQNTHTTTHIKHLSPLNKQTKRNKQHPQTNKYTKQKQTNHTFRQTQANNSANKNKNKTKERTK